MSISLSIVTLLHLANLESLSRLGHTGSDTTWEQNQDRETIPLLANTF